MFKWIGIVFIAVIVYMIATGNMGGSKKATQNYADVMSGKKK
jgi:cbb3-type cytochrome oxidase subunit 3